MSKTIVNGYELKMDELEIVSGGTDALDLLVQVSTLQATNHLTDDVARGSVRAGWNVKANVKAA